MGTWEALSSGRVLVRQRQFFTSSQALKTGKFKPTLITLLLTLSNPSHCYPGEFPVILLQFRNSQPAITSGPAYEVSNANSDIRDLVFRVVADSPPPSWIRMPVSVARDELIHTRWFAELAKHIQSCRPSCPEFGNYHTFPTTSSHLSHEESSHPSPTGASHLPHRINLQTSPLPSTAYCEETDGSMVALIS